MQGNPFLLAEHRLYALIGGCQVVITCKAPKNTEALDSSLARVFSDGLYELT